MWRRGCVVLLVLAGISVGMWERFGQYSSAASEDAYSVSTEETDGHNRDEAACRYRMNQPRHWKHVVVGLK